MGITGLLPFIEKASRRTNVSEFNGCTVAIDSYCWLHKGAFACADKLVRGEHTDVHIRYCLKYVDMLLSKNVKPILVFDGRHLPAKALTESKRRESRNISKKRAAELLSLGKMEEARSYMRRSVDITHEMALSLIKECRNRNVDCIVAPYEADSQLAYLNIKNYAHVVITEDSDLILFGCTKVLFKMDLDGTGTLVETAKLPLIMKCPIENYSFDKFRQMCVLSGCDYLASLPGIGLAKARQFITATQDSNIANALKKLPSFFNRANLTVTDEYRENFLKAEATFKHQYVYDPQERSMVRLTDPDDEDIEQALCVNAGELLEPKVAFQLALGNLDPFTLNKMDDWHPDYRPTNVTIKTSNWKNRGISNYPSIWSADFKPHLVEPSPWQKKPKVSVGAFAKQATRKVVNLVSKVVPETQDQDESLTIESLSNMYCIEPSTKRQKVDASQHSHKNLTNDDIVSEIKKEKSPSPILENKQRSFIKREKNESHVLKRLSRFPRTVVSENVVASKFFCNSTNISENTSKMFNEKSKNPFKKTEVDLITETSTTSEPRANISIIVEESPEKRNSTKSIETIENTSNVSNSNVLDQPHKSKNPFKKSVESDGNTSNKSYNSIIIEDSPRNSIEISIDNDETFCTDGNTSKKSCNSILMEDSPQNSIEISIDNDETICTEFSSSQKENSPMNSPIKYNGPVKSPILEPSPNRRLFGNVPKRLDQSWSDDTVIENTYPMQTLLTPVDSQESFGRSLSKPVFWSSQQRVPSSQPAQCTNAKKNCRVPGLKRTTSLPSNQPTLLSKFGFQKKPTLKR